MTTASPAPAALEPRPASPIIELRSGDARAAIALRGAEPVAWSVGGRRLLWDADTVWWAKSAPVLFPVIAQTRHGTVKVEGVSYPMALHGFAPATWFAVERQREDRVRMILRDSPETLKSYPFAFELSVEYCLNEASLEAEFEVVDPGDRPLPYALGFHPGFRWPFAGGAKHDHAIMFERDEEPSVPAIAPAGLIRSERRPVPLIDRKLALPEDLIAGLPLCFLDARSHSLRFENGIGGAIAVAVDNFPHLVVWGKAGGPFLSIEAWTGTPDPEDFDGELALKPWMRFLPPGASARHAVRLAYLAAPKN